MTKLERKLYDQKRYRKHRERKAEYNKNYRNLNKVAIKLCNKRYRHNHKTKIKKYLTTYRRANKAKIAATVKTYGLKHQEDIRTYQRTYQRTNQRQRLYGSSTEQLNSMLTRQKNKCAICQNAFKSSKSTHLDHNHKTKQIRAFLCTSCNVGLGYFKENVSLLQTAIKYIKKWNTI